MLENTSYSYRLSYLGIPRLELHRLYFDLIFCYKIVLGLVHVKFEDFFVQTRGHAYKMYKARYCNTARRNFFAERVVNIWNFLPRTIDFSSLVSFRPIIESVDFTDFLKCIFD